MKKCMKKAQVEFLGPPTSLQWLTGCKELGVRSSRAPFFLEKKTFA